MAELALYTMGGTGTKIAKAFVMMHLTGYNFYGENAGSSLHLCPIDIDRESPHMVQVGALCQAYDVLHGIVAGFPSTKIVMHNNLGIASSNPPEIGFADIVGNKLKNDMIFRSMFTQSQRALLTKGGTVGDAQVGIVLTALELNKTEGGSGIDKYVERLSNTVKNEITAGHFHSCITGSVFGGSGSSGVPTLFRHMYKKICSILGANDIGNNTIDMVLSLPYFTYANNNNEDTVAADQHILRTKIGLRRYHEMQLQQEHPNKIFYVGGYTQRCMTRNDGEPQGYYVSGAQQDNPSMPEEIYAALACTAALSGGVQDNNENNGNNTRYEYVCADTSLSSEKFGLANLPFTGENGGELIRRIKGLNRFAVLLYGYYYPRIAGTAANGNNNLYTKERDKIPALKKCFPQNAKQKTAISDGIGKINTLNTAAEYMCKWFEEQRNNGEYRSELLAFTTHNNDNKNNVISIKLQGCGINNDDRKVLSAIVTQMNGIQKQKDNNPDMFIAMLYSYCMNSAD